jgi:rare lipoprotein A
MTLARGTLAALGFATLLAACSTTQKQPAGSRYAQSHDGAPDRAVDVSGIKDAIPRVEPKSRYGNPASYVVFGKRYHTLSSSDGYTQRGIASWYGTKFHGHRTSSGEPYDMYQMSAAHKTLPLPTYARITNLNNNKSVIVKINDRGPFHDNRIIDLSYAAAAKLDILGNGTGLVQVEAIDPRSYSPQSTSPTLLASKPKVSGTIQTVKQTEPASSGYKPTLYLQVGAFANRGNAERLKKRLSSSELPGHLLISEGLSNEKPIYRVRIGPLASVETADRLTQLLVAQGIESPRVVID